MKKRCFLFTVVMILLFIGVHPTNAGERVIFLDSSGVRAMSSEDSISAQSYLITFPTPQGIVRGGIQAAVLEFYADVYGVETETYQSESALIEVYGVDDLVVGELDPEQLRKPSAMTRNVVVGENQHILVDITEFLRYNLNQQDKSHSLLVGFVRTCEGVFRIRDGAFGSGKPARLTIVEVPTSGRD